MISKFLYEIHQPMYSVRIAIVKSPSMTIWWTSSWFSSVNIRWVVFSLAVDSLQKFRCWYSLHLDKITWYRIFTLNHHILPIFLIQHDLNKIHYQLLNWTLMTNVTKHLSVDKLPNQWLYCNDASHWLVTEYNLNRIC